MINNISNYKEDITTMCNYIIKRNYDIDFTNMSAVEIDRIGLEPNDNYIIFIGDRKINLTAFTSISDCKYILENIDNITYLHSMMDSFDTIVGDVSSFITTTFKCGKFDTRYRNVLRQYNKFIKAVETSFTKNDIINYIDKNRS